MKGPLSAAKEFCNEEIDVSCYTTLAFPPQGNFSVK